MPRSSAGQGGGGLFFVLRQSNTSICTVFLPRLCLPIDGLVHFRVTMSGWKIHKFFWITDHSLGTCFWNRQSKLLEWRPPAIWGNPEVLCSVLEFFVGKLEPMVAVSNLNFYSLRSATCNFCNCQCIEISKCPLSQDFKSPVSPCSSGKYHVWKASILYLYTLFCKCEFWKNMSIVTIRIEVADQREEGGYGGWYHRLKRECQIFPQNFQYSRLIS